MASVPITVVIPVGPREQHQRWLDEAIQSAFDQTYKPTEILLLDDMAFLSPAWTLPRSYYFVPGAPDIHIYRPPWHVGVYCAYNFGVALAENECVFILNSDDKLMPTCLEKCWESYHKNNQKDAWYFVNYQLSESGEVQGGFVAPNIAMMTKGLFKLMGGFPLEGVIGGGDCLMNSIISKHYNDRLIQVAEEPLYWHRQHEGQFTAYQSSKFAEEVYTIRGKVVNNYVAPEWTKKWDIDNELFE